MDLVLIVEPFSAVFLPILSLFYKFFQQVNGSIPPAKR